MLKNKKTQHTLIRYYPRDLEATCLTFWKIHFLAIERAHEPALLDVLKKIFLEFIVSHDYS